MAPFPILLTDARGTIIEANQAAKDALGPCVGRRCSDMVCVRDAAGASTCTSACAGELSYGGGGRTQHGRVRGKPRKVICSAVGDQSVVMLMPSAAPQAQRDRLSPRETEVLQLVSEGLTGKRIAERLGISFATVRTHVEHARAKLRASTRAEAVMKAGVLGLIEVT